MTSTVTDVPERSRYEISLDGRSVGFADYQLRGDVVVLPHTVVSPEFRGQGLAGRLIRHALDDIRAHGRTVAPQCSFVAAFIDKHPEEADLVTR